MFFNALKDRKRMVAIDELLDDQGNLLQEEKQKTDWAQAFFVKLLAKPASTGLEDQETDHILSFCRTRVNGIQRERLEADFTNKELLEATMELGKNKAPGPDSLPLEFFLLLWEAVAPSLLRFATTGLQNGKLPPFVTAGDIILLPKEGDQKLLQNKRSITLLNAGYKILAKAIQKRLAPVL
ncbi:hypothetical protein R1flu_025014 [Riccia fluitans]|uniref:Reverse transcriptase domain-containing protein n=1 Tax=Riccia fluitans TaxID=41844 RepID=A0ABD1XWJ2_9MARC